jgi:hypothetical protein
LDEEVAVGFMTPHESGQADPFGDILGDVIGGGAVQGGVKQQLLAQLQDPDVQAQLRTAARPLMLEAAAYIFGAVALALVLFRK